MKMERPVLEQFKAIVLLEEDGSFRPQYYWVRSIMRTTMQFSNDLLRTRQIPIFAITSASKQLEVPFLISVVVLKLRTRFYL
jgi:hypothetical protein